MGMVSILFGLLVIVWPGLPLTALAIAFAVYVLVSGLLGLTYAFEAGIVAPWLSKLVIGFIILLLAGYVFLRPDLTATGLLRVAAGWAVLAGLFEMVAVWTMGWPLGLAAGALTVAAGLVLLVNPHQGTLAPALVIGIFAIIRGIIFLANAFFGLPVSER